MVELQHTFRVGDEPVDPSTEEDLFRPRVFAKAGEVVFRAGEARTSIFEVQSGAVVLVRDRPGPKDAFVRTARPGEFLGLGFLETHIDTAVTVVDCVLQRFSQNEFELEAVARPALQEQLATAVEQDFEARKRQLTEAETTSPLERLASLLVVLSRQNAQEGRDPFVIADELNSGVVSQLLNVSMDDLVIAMVTLKRMDILEEGAEGALHIRDFGSLLAIADDPGRA